MQFLALLAAKSLLRIDHASTGNFNSCDYGFHGHHVKAHRVGKHTRYHIVESRHQDEFGLVEHYSQCLVAHAVTSSSPR